MRLLVGLALAAAVFALAAPTRAADDDKWITIKGKIVLDPAVADVPARSEIEVKQDAAHCLMNGKLLDNKLIVNKKNRGVKNVVVWIAPDAPPKSNPKFPAASIHPTLVKPAKDTVEIDQPCCAFEPHVLLARDGQKFVIKNSSPVSHNAAGGNKTQGQFNPIIPAGKQYDHPDALKADRLPMEVRCSIHPWMNAWIRVYDHPYFAVTDADGNFEIKLAPTGNFRLFVWQEDVGFVGSDNQGTKIELSPKTADRGTISLKPAPAGK